MMDWNGSWGNQMMDGGWGWFGVAMMIIIVFAAVALVAWLVRSSAVGPDRRDNGGESPSSIIDARFARGEIDEAQRDQMMQALS